MGRYSEYYYLPIHGKILKVVNERRLVAAVDIAKEIGVSYSTAQQRAEQLYEAGELDRLWDEDRSVGVTGRWQYFPLEEKADG